MPAMRQRSQERQSSSQTNQRTGLSSRHYFYVGHYKCRSISNSPDLIAAAERRSNRPGKLSYVIYLDPA